MISQEARTRVLVFKLKKGGKIRKVKVQKILNLQVAFLQVKREQVKILLINMLKIPD